MQHHNTTNRVPAQVRRLSDAEASALGVRILERLSRRTDRGGVVARVMRAINSMRHQTLGAVDAAVTLTRLSSYDAKKLTEMAAEIVHSDDTTGGAR